MMLAATLNTLLLLAPQPAERVGVFDGPSLVLAYYRSELWLSQVRAKREAMEAAKRSGDRRAASELDRQGRDSQRLAHRQLAGRAPIDNIWKALQPHLPRVAFCAGVSRVVLEAPPGVETVDVTSCLLDVLQADASTRNMVEELRRRRSRRSSGR